MWALDEWHTMAYVRDVLGVSDYGLRQYIKHNDVMTGNLHGQMLVRLRDLEGMHVPLKGAIRLAKELANAVS